MKNNLMRVVLVLSLCAVVFAVWNKDKPSSSTSLRNSNPEMLANQSALETALAQDHEFSTGGTNSGKHEVLTMEEEASAGASAINELHVQAIDGGSGQPEFAITSEDGIEIQITSAGKILSASLDMKDEDNMSSDSATHAATQQSIKAYGDSATQTMTNKTLTSPVINTAISGTAFLDEDNMASDSATKVASQQSIKAFVNTNRTRLAGEIVQIVNTQTGAVATGSTTIPRDDTIPQNTEGDEYMTLAITPTNSNNKLKIDIVCQLAHTSGNLIPVVALFQDSTANALACMIDSGSADGNAERMVSFTHFMTAGTTSSTTFKVRAGQSGGGTMTFNGSSGVRRFGGVLASSITITEIKV